MSRETLKIDKGIASRIYEARKEAGLKQEKLAELVDVSVMTIKRIEGCRKGGTYLSTPYNVQKIADALDVSIEQLLGHLYIENSEKWSSFVDRWARLKENDMPWFTCDGAGWDTAMDEMNITCNRFPVKDLIMAICANGGKELVMDGLKEYENSEKSQK